MFVPRFRRVGDVLPTGGPALRGKTQRPRVLTTRQDRHTARREAPLAVLSNPQPFYRPSGSVPVRTANPRAWWIETSPRAPSPFHHRREFPLPERVVPKHRVFQLFLLRWRRSRMWIAEFA